MAGTTYDVVILGGGNAGMGVTVPTREAGLSVALAEGWDLGGTCPNRGCTPKKVLVAAAHALDEIERAKEHGIAVGKPSLDWAALIDREKNLIDGLPQSFARTLAGRGVDVLHGQARFVAPNAVRVDERTLEARHFVIATGSKPRALPIPGAEHLITSDDVLSERTQPASVVFIGGGVIALEFSHVYARAGTKVTILEVLPRLLPRNDAEAVARIQAESERIGIDVRTKAAVRRVEARDGRFRVVFEHDGREQALEAERIINGAGRVADVDGLDLEAGRVAHERERLSVDEYLRSTSNPAVYACGDVLWSTPQLSPLATYEGRLVGRNIVDGPIHKPDLAGMPSCVFTVPALASVGMTEEEARASGAKVKVTTTDMADWFSTLTYAETTAWAKTIVDEGSGQILGVHLVGHAAEELIHLFGLAIKHRIPVGGVMDLIFAFPTFSADMKSVF